MKQDPTFSPSRRRFLRGDPAGKREALLPPWSNDATTFYARCTACGDCVSACPEHVLARGADGFPYINFNAGGCTFCGECLNHCKPQALRRLDGMVPWQLRVSIGENCLALRQVVCRTCEERCEVGAITFTPALGGVSHPTLNHTLCTSCGFCVADCPTSAIHISTQKP